MTFFWILLSCHNSESAFDLYEEIMNIYAYPYNQQSSEELCLLLNRSSMNDILVGSYLVGDGGRGDNPEPHFLDEVDITTNTIIHGSPFSEKACKRNRLLKNWSIKIL